MLRRSLALAALLASGAITPAHAGCSSPSGNTADIIYSSAYHTLQFCNGISWVPFGTTLATGGGGGGCSNPSGHEGDQFYNGAYHTYQFCNGTNWVSMAQGGSVSGGGAGCSNPTGHEADLIYNVAYGTYQFCNGTSWIAMGGMGISASSYTGPGDIVSGATAWYGLRAYSGAVAATGTQKAINIRRASDNTTTDIYILTGGNLDTATASNFCTSTTCFVTKWYDQSGNGHDASQATATSQPQLLLSGCSAAGLPCLFFNTSDAQYFSANTVSLANPWSISGVAERASVSGNDEFLACNASGSGICGGFGGTANSATLYDGNSLNATATDNQWHALQFLSGSSGVVNVDGVETTGNAGTSSMASTLAVGAETVGTRPMHGYVTEVGLWAGFSAGQRSSLCQNQQTYWGIGTGNCYVGPGDIVSGAAAWYGLRAYTAAIAAAGTQKLVNVRNTATNETCDIIVATSGGMGNVANCSGSSNGDTPAVFCAESSGSCAVAKLYDQSGNGNNVTQSTAATQPILTLSCINSLPCMAFSGSQHLDGTSMTALSQPYTMTIVSMRTGNTSNYAVPWGTNSNGNGEMEFFDSANNWSMYAGARLSATANDSAWHVGQGIFNGASSKLNIDNTATSGSASSGAAGTTPGVGDRNSSFPITGDIVEEGIWSGGFITTQQTSVCHNAYLYWGTGTSC